MRIVNTEYDKLFSADQLPTVRKTSAVNSRPMRMLLRIREIIYGIANFNQSKLHKQGQKKERRSTAQSGLAMKTVSKLMSESSRTSNYRRL